MIALLILAHESPLGALAIVVVVVAFVALLSVLGVPSYVDDETSEPWE